MGTQKKFVSLQRTNCGVSQETSYGAKVIKDCQLEMKKTTATVSCIPLQLNKLDYHHYYLQLLFANCNYNAYRAFANRLDVRPPPPRRSRCRSPLSSIIAAQLDSALPPGTVLGTRQGSNQVREG